MVKELLTIVRKNLGSYALWFFSNIGGLLIAILSCITIKIYHGNFGKYIPGPDVFLVTGTICIFVTGLSYMRLASDIKTTELSPWLSLSWPFPVMIVYGVLISMGIPPLVLNDLMIYIIAFFILIVCIFWSTLLWAHEQQLRKDKSEEPKTPAMSNYDTDNLPKLD